jgi:hypothetical protein
VKWQGKMHGRAVEGTVLGGACHGSFEVVSMVEAMVAAQTRVGEGPVSGPADLTDPILSRATLRAVLDPDTATFEGDEAPVGTVPADAET